MDRGVATTPAQAMPPASDYWRIVDFVAGGRETPWVQTAVKQLSVASDGEQQRIKRTLAAARNPTLAIRRLLFSACEQGNLPLVELLLPWCDVDAVDEYGNTALVRSAVCARLQVVKFLLDNGANPLSDGSYALLLQKALIGGNVKIVELVLLVAGNCAEVDEILGRSTYYFSKAVSLDDVEFAALLLAYGVSALSETERERRSLLRSIRSVEMAELLYSHGADFGGDAGLEAVVDAMCRRNGPLLVFFLDHGVDIRRFQYKAASPLHCACIYSRIDWVELLAAQCIDLDCRLEDGSTPLQKCFLGGADGHRIHQRLVDLGADVNARSNSGLDSRYRGPSSWSEPERTEDLWESKERMRQAPPVGSAAV